MSSAWFWLMNCRRLLPFVPMYPTSSIQFGLNSHCVLMLHCWRCGVSQIG